MYAYARYIKRPGAAAVRISRCTPLPVKTDCQFHGSLPRANWILNMLVFHLEYTKKKSKVLLPVALLSTFYELQGRFSNNVHGLPVTKFTLTP
jgi:hypothetical protein